MDELNLYDDLDEFQEQQEKKSKELQDLELKYQDSLKTIEALQSENVTLKKNIKRIEINFQSLLDTARAEIKRKNREIEHLRKEKDDICFRRRLLPKAGKESHNVELSTDEKLQKPISKPFKGQEKINTTSTVTNTTLDKDTQESQNEQQSTYDPRGESSKRSRSRDREHLKEHKRLKYIEDNQIRSYKYEQQNNRYADKSSSSTRDDYNINNSREHRNYENPERYRKTDNSYYSTKHDGHRRPLNRNQSRDEYKKYKSPERNKETGHSHTSESPNRHRRHRYRSNSRERYSFKSRPHNEDNNYSKTTSKSPSPPRCSGDGQHNEKRKISDRITTVKYHKEFDRDVGQESLEKETLMENPISTKSKITENLKRDSKDIKKKFECKEKDIYPSKNSSANVNQIESVSSKESSLKQDTNVTTQNESASASVFGREHDNHESKLSVDDITKLCTPRNLALLNELFGQTPSTASSTKSLLNYTKELHANSTTPIELISSATTSPYNYANVSSCVSKLNVIDTIDISSESKDQHDIEVWKNNTKNNIDECFLRNENVESEKTIASVDLTKIIEDDIANEIQYLQIPGQDLHRENITINDGLKTPYSNVSGLLKTHISYSNEVHEVQNDKFKDNEENEQKNKSSEADSIPLLDLNEKMNTDESMRSTKSPVLFQNITHIDNAKVSNAAEVDKDKNTENDIKIKNIESSEDVIQTVFNNEQDFTAAESSICITSNNSQADLDPSYTANTSLDSTTCTEESPQCIVSEMEKPTEAEKNKKPFIKIKDIESNENVGQTILNYKKDLTATESNASITSNNSQVDLEPTNIENILSDCTTIAEKSPQCITTKESEKPIEDNEIPEMNITDGKNDKSDDLSNASDKTQTQEILTAENVTQNVVNSNLDIGTEFSNFLIKATGAQLPLDKQDFCKEITNTIKVNNISETSQLSEQEPLIGEQAVEKGLCENETSISLNNEMHAMETTNVLNTNENKTATIADCVTETEANENKKDCERKKSHELGLNYEEIQKNNLEKETLSNVEDKPKIQFSSCLTTQNDKIEKSAYKENSCLKAHNKTTELENAMKEGSSFKSHNKNKELKNETINITHIMTDVDFKYTENSKIKSLLEKVTRKDFIQLKQSEESLNFNELSNNELDKLQSCHISKSRDNVKETVMETISNDIKTVKPGILETLEVDKDENIQKKKIIDLEETDSKNEEEPIYYNKQTTSHFENSSLELKQLTSSINSTVNENQKEKAKVLQVQAVEGKDLYEITPEPLNTNLNVKESFTKELNENSNSEIQKPETSIIPISNGIKNVERNQMQISAAEQTKKMSNESLSSIENRTTDYNKEVRKLESPVSNSSGIKNQAEHKQMQNPADKNIDTNSNECQTQCNIYKISPSYTVLNTFNETLTKKTEQIITQDLTCAIEEMPSPQKTNNDLRQSHKKEEENSKLIASSKSEAIPNQDETQNLDLPNSSPNQEPLISFKEIPKTKPQESSTADTGKTESCREASALNQFLTNKANELQKIGENIEITTLSTNLSNKAVLSINFDDKRSENEPFVGQKSPNDLKSSFAIIEPQKVENLTPKKCHQELYDSRKNSTNILTIIPDSYNASPIPLPSISTSSPTPSNFSGIFSKRSSFLHNPTEDDFHKFKRKSLLFTTRPREYILPAASVLCNMDNLENATKLNKKLHWELLNNKHELTEIEDDTDINTTDEEHQQFENEIKQEQTSPKSSYLNEQDEQSNENYKNVDSVRANSGQITYKFKNMPCKIQKAKHRKYKITRNVKAKIKAARIDRLDSLPDSFNLIDQKPLTAVFPKRQRGRPRKLENVLKSTMHSKKTKTSILTSGRVLKKRGRKPKKPIESNNNINSQKCDKQNTDLTPHKENVKTTCALSSDQNPENMKKCVKEINQDEKQPNEISKEIEHNSNAVKNSLNDKDIPQKSLEIVCTNNTECATNNHTISNDPELKIIKEKSKDNNEEQKLAEISKKDKVLTDHSTPTNFDKEKCSFNDENAADSSQKETSKTEMELNTEFIPENINLESNKAIAPLKDENKNCDEFSITSADSDEKLLIISDSGQETSEKQVQDSQEETTLILKSPEKPIKNKKSAAAIRKPQKLISLEDIGIKVRPFKGHLSSFRIPKINRDREQPCHNSWKLEAYVEVDKDKGADKLKEDKKEVKKMNIQKESLIIPIFSSHKGSLSSYRIPKIKTDTVDHKNDTIKKFETNEKKPKNENEILENKDASTVNKEINQNKETEFDKKDKQKVSFESANKFHKDTSEKSKKLDRVTPKEQSISKINFDDKTNTGKRKLLSLEEYNQHDSDNNKGQTKTSSDYKKSNREENESQEVLPIKHRRKYLNLRRNVLDSSSDEEEIAEKTNESKTRHLKTLQPIRSQRKYTNIPRKILDSSCDENEKDNEAVYKVKISENNRTIERLESTTTDTFMTDSYSYHQRQSDKKESSNNEIKVHESTESSKLEVHAKAIKVRRKSMCVESLVSKETLDTKDSTEQIDEKISLRHNIKSVNPLKPRRKSMFLESAPAETLETSAGLLLNKAADKEFYIDDKKDAEMLNSTTHRESVIIESSSSKITAIDNSTLRLDINDNKKSDFMIMRRKSLSVESVSKTNDSEDSGELANNTKCIEKISSLKIINAIENPIVVETISVKESNTEEIILKKIETEPDKIKKQVATNCPKAARNVTDSTEINNCLALEQKEKKESKIDEHCTETDSDSSVVLTQQNSIIRRKSTNQKRKLDSSSEDSELLMGEPCMTPTQSEIKTFLKATEPKAKSRKRRVVKVVSTSMEAQNISTNSSLRSDNITQPSPFASPLLNHPIFNTEVSTQSNEFVASMPLTPIQQDDKKFEEIDSELHAIFQSPQYITDYKANPAMNIVDLNNSSSILTTSLQHGNITIDETLDANEDNNQSSTNMEKLNDSNSNSNSITAAHNCSEIKHLSLGSAEYRFEKVSENVVNLFISRKRKRKRNN